MKKQHLAVLAALIIALIALVFFTLQSENQKSSGTDATQETSSSKEADKETEADTETETDADSGDEGTVATVDYEKSYAQKCSTCHGGDLSGGVGPDLTQIGSQMTKEEIEKIIIDGIGIMPSGQLKGEEAAAVAEWLAGMK
ncbi:cytochrome c [Robertmurraya massiliosenegalensis]|uniref:c-type cytochrome n=1 Tax=Robertmurraya TaxID=2837507 RepID=UPI0039A4E5CF